MKRMPEPNVTHDEILGACREGIDDTIALAAKFDGAIAALNIAATHYRHTSSSGQLYTIAPAGGGDPLVISTLKKSELIKLYEYYLRGKKPGRYLYDKILASANEQCPFCGGIGRPRNLDHYMPKAYYPQFSVLPINLIPSCRDCNMDGKGQTHAASAETQILHPIMDAAHFFDTQWIFAEYTSSTEGEPSFIRYYVDPPINWSDIDKARAHQHFQDFDIAKRYSTQAASALVEVEAVIEALRLADPNIDVKAIALQPVINQLPYLNHWKRVMYTSLIEVL